MAITRKEKTIVEWKFISFLQIHISKQQTVYKEMIHQTHKKKLYQISLS